MPARWGPRNEVGTHNSEVAGLIRSALEAEPEVCIVSGLRYLGRRDDPIEIEAIARDWFRAFHIRVEVLRPEDVAFDPQTGEWDDASSDEEEAEV